MPLPTQIDNQVRQRFEILLEEGETLAAKMREEDIAIRNRSADRGIIRAGKLHLSEAEFYSLRTRFLTLVNFLSNDGDYFTHLEEDIRTLENTDDDAAKLSGFLRGLKDDYEAGMLENLVETIEANIAADYLGQAEQLLQEGQPGKFDHVPAAVLLGAILEDALRRICQRQSPPITVVKNGKPKRLGSLIDDLKKANVFKELKAKQLRSWADIRNAAAHGEFNKFNRNDVEQMQTGVQNFLADHL